MYSLRMTPIIGGGPLALPEALRGAFAAERARIRARYPWWLKPWLSRNIAAITLGRTIYVGELAGRTEEALTRLLRHELAHVRQVNRHGLVVFLARYIAEFARNLVRARSFHDAYSRISFEVEARAAEETPDV